MVQHVSYSIIAAPLLLIGTPDLVGALAALTAVAAGGGAVSASRLIPATILFNLVVIVTHTPVVVNAALQHALVHFAVHTLIFSRRSSCGCRC